MNDKFFFCSRVDFNECEGVVAKLPTAGLNPELPIHG